MKSLPPPQVTENSTGDEVFSLSLPVSLAGQMSSQTVTLPDLDLDSVQYRITVSATNQVGTGPHSTPIFVGTGICDALELPRTTCTPI